MMHETGLVTRIQKTGFASVTPLRGEFCGSCPCRGTCQVLGGKTERQIVAINRVGATVGDWVLVSIGAGSFLKISSIVYLLPILALAAGSYVGEKYSTQIWPAGNPETVSILTGLFCVGISLMIIRLFSGRLSQNHKYYPVIEKVLHHSPLPLIEPSDRNHRTLLKKGNPASIQPSLVLPPENEPNFRDFF
jgi:sigma-E factor negative regulatory protein RseC